MSQPKRSPKAKPAPEKSSRTLLNPVDAVLLTRDRLQEIVDDAVRRGRMTHQDATELMQEIFSRGRREVDRARRATGLGGTFPIAGYEDLTAAQVQTRLDDLSDPELRKVRDYERRNANRKTVLAAIETKLGQ